MYVLCEQTVGHEGHRSRQGADTLTPRHHANRRSRQPTGSMINFIAIHVRTYLVRMVKYPHACTVHALYMEFLPLLNSRSPPACPLSDYLSSALGASRQPVQSR